MGQELNGKFPEIKALAKIMDFKNYLGLGVGAIVGVGWVVVAGDWLVRGGAEGSHPRFHHRRTPSHLCRFDNRNQPVSRKIQRSPYGQCRVLRLHQRLIHHLPVVHQTAKNSSVFESSLQGQAQNLPLLRGSDGRPADHLHDPSRIIRPAQMAAGIYRLNGMDPAGLRGLQTPQDQERHN